MAFLIDERIGIDKVFDIRRMVNPHIFFGVGAVDRAGVEAKKLGAKKAAIMSDKGVEKAGLVDKVTRILEKEKLECEAYTNIEWEPTIESYRSAGAFVRKGKFDFVIGLGGGTCVDTCKVVSYLATNPGDVSDYASFPDEPASKAFSQERLPNMNIPTTAGTGAAYGAGGTLIKPGKLMKGGVSGTKPTDVVIVDPAMCLTLPPRQSAATGMDGLKHMIEFFLGPTSLPLADALLLKSISMYYKNVRTVFFNGKDIQARWNLSLAEILWGWIPNILGWEGRDSLPAYAASIVGPKYKIPHGVAAAVVLPYCMEFTLSASVDRLALIAEAFGEDIRSQPLRGLAFRAVKLVEELAKDVELPTSLKELNVLKEDLPEVVDYILKYCPPGRRPLTKENVTELFNRMWEGKIGQGTL